MLRSGEARVGWLSALLAGLIALQAIALARVGPAGIGFDLATLAACVGLATGLFGFFSAATLARTQGELERAEALHWDGMEGVRGLTDLAARRGARVEERLPVLLEMGCERTGTSIGLVARVRGERYEVVAIHAPDEFPVSPGAVFALNETLCRGTLESERPIAAARGAHLELPDHPSRTALRFEAYLGAAIRTGDDRFGTLVFADLMPRRHRFSATHKDLVTLMAQWIGFEVERAEQALRAAPWTASAATATRAGGGVPAVTGLRLNAALQRLLPRIRQVAGKSVDVRLELAPDLALAQPLRLPLETLVLSLVGRAARAMPDGGILTLRTANQELGAAPDVLPAVAPNRYVTLSVLESGGGLDADALARLFAGEDDAEEQEPLDLRAPQLPLSLLYGALQRAGGDLAVEAEPGRGTRFTVFLPDARSPEARRLPASDAPAPAEAGAAVEPPQS